MRIKLHSYLIKLVPNENGVVNIECQKAITVKELLQILGLTNGEVGLVISDSESLKQNDILNQGNEVSVYPIIGGG